MNALLKLVQADPFEFTHRMSGGRHSAIPHSFFTTRQSRGMGCSMLTRLSSVSTNEATQHLPAGSGNLMHCGLNVIDRDDE